MLYIFAGFPKSGLTAGGLQHCIEIVEELGLLQNDLGVHYRKEGVFSGDKQESEWLYPVEYRISDYCLLEGISWDWFPEKWNFGGGVTIHKTSASSEFKIVVHGTDLNLDQFLAKYGTTRLAELELERLHVRHEGWEKYEARWLRGTCPQESHIVHLTWLVTQYKLPEFAYERIRHIIEDSDAKLLKPELYLQRHFSASRPWDGKPVVHLGVPAGAIG